MSLSICDCRHNIWVWKINMGLFKGIFPKDNLFRKILVPYGIHSDNTWISAMSWVGNFIYSTFIL